jgi:3-oxoacyl-[acyl-carrier-protein] synthase III
VIAACREGVSLLGIGSHVPDRVMTNDEIATMVDTSDEWIAQRTGIRERRIAAPHESSASLGAEAARRAIESAAIDPTELDLIVAATASPDYYFPATASLIGERIGADNVAGYDLSAACTGFIYALAQGYSQIASGLAETVLVVGTEVFSRLLDWGDRSTCILFGDGAGAVVLRRDQAGRGLRGFEMGADGRGACLLSVAAVGHSETEPLRADERPGGLQVCNPRGGGVLGALPRGGEPDRGRRRRLRAPPGEPSHHRPRRPPAEAGRGSCIRQR